MFHSRAKLARRRWPGSLFGSATQGEHSPLGQAQMEAHSLCNAVRGFPSIQRNGQLCRNSEPFVIYFEVNRAPSGANQSKVAIASCLAKKRHVTSPPKHIHTTGSRKRAWPKGRCVIYSKSSRTRILDPATLLNPP